MSRQRLPLRPGTGLPPARPQGLPWPHQPAEPSPLPASLPGGRPWPKISIVTPSLNQGAFIEETILSVLHQGYPNVEHIVVDGLSGDATPAILERYRDRLAHVASEKDKGQSEAINKGFARATGDILTWLNADDMLAPGALAAVALAFATSEADMVAGICVIQDAGRVQHRHLTAAAEGPLELDELLDLEGGWLSGEFFYQPEVFFSRALWQRAGARVDESLYYSMDYELWLRFAEAGAVLHAIGRPLALFRVHPDQKTHAPERFQAELRRLRAAYLERTARPAPPARGRAADNRRLRVAMINDVGDIYGAGIAHGRIAEGLRLAGHEVLSTSLRALRSDAPKAATPQDRDALRAALQRWLARTRPDLAILGNLHAAGGEPELLSTVSASAPALWVLHDFWLLTGRCAFTGDCGKYLAGCDAGCPTPREYPALEPAMIAPAWKAKRAILAGAQAPVILSHSPSAAAFARGAFADASARPRIEEFRLGIPLDIFQPQDRALCRRRLGLPADAFIILFSAAAPTDRRKGGAHLFEALARLRDLAITCCVIGNWDHSVPLPDIDIRSLGYLKDAEDLATAYGAADIFVGPSLAETFGQVFIEAAACGTPVIGYPVMGVESAIRDGVTGRLAAGVGADHLEAAIRELHADPALRAAMGRWGRIFVENEWSTEAGYRHLFLALQRLGLPASLGVPRRINFAPAPRRARGAGAERWKRGEGIGELEGPYPGEGLTKRFHWCMAPVSRARLVAETDGLHLILLEYQNVWLAKQQITVHLDDRPLGTYSVRRTPRDSTRALCLRAHLTPGSHELRLEFARALRSRAADRRRLALMINDIHLEPLPAQARAAPAGARLSPRD
jgi:glycosyltransferase involved in cell wall biosynthesis